MQIIEKRVQYPSTFSKIRCEAGDWAGFCPSCSAVLMLASPPNQPDLSLRTSCHDSPMAYVAVDPGTEMELEQVETACWN